MIIHIRIRMTPEDCRSYFASDHRRLPALNAIRHRKGCEPYSLDEAASMMASFGGCSREDFENIDLAIRGEINGSAQPAVSLISSVPDEFHDPEPER